MGPRTQAQEDLEVWKWGGGGGGGVPERVNGPEGVKFWDSTQVNP